MTRTRMLTLAGIILAAAAMRLMPHPWNFTPVAAMALFAGAHISHRAIAFALPLAAMLLSDLVLGFHTGMPFVYGAFAMMVGLGLFLRTRVRPLPVLGASLCASLLFFVVTNLGAWAVGGLYPPTGAGLMASYTAAIPFFAHTLAGDLFYSAVLFGGFALLQRSIPVLRMGGSAEPAVG